MTDEAAFAFGEDPDHPGWYSWRLRDATRYNAFLGPLLVRMEGDIARVRMLPTRQHTNLQDSIHGGTTMGFADVALFAAARMMGLIAAGSAVTLEMTFQFIGSGSPGVHLDAEVELLRETRRMLFMRGLVVQGDARLAAFSGTIRKSVGKGIVEGVKTLDRYNALVAAGELRPDPTQADAAARLDRLQAQLEAVPPRGSVLWRLGKAKPPPPRGIYLWGGVGRGKSMLMDLFYGCLDIRRKRRVHFHEFMLDVHDRLRHERMKEAGDPIAPTVAALADEARCLAFDEMVVNNSADAMILSRLFTGLLDAGVTVVTTSNRAPSDLYKDGLNREHFLPFIATIERRLDVVPLNGPTDYRMQRMAGLKTWHVPSGPEATAAVREAFFRMTDYPPEDAVHVPTADIDLGGGRMLHVPKSLKGVAVFSFKRLCGEARGASDYLAVARRYHTVFVVGIPKLGPENRNEAARFVTLIDALYEHKVKLIATADAEPGDLYAEGDGRFEFERTVSRLMEMQSADYLF